MSDAEAQEVCWQCDSLILGTPPRLILNYDFETKRYERIALCSKDCYHDFIVTEFERFDKEKEEKRTAEADSNCEAHS